MKFMRKQHGITLVELIIVTTIIAILSIGAVELLRVGSLSQLTITNSQQAAWEGQVAINRITEDLHSIKSVSSISIATSTVLTFTNTDGTTISYQLSGNNLMRNSQVLASNISGLAFTYYTSTGTTTTTLTDIRYIGVNFTITNQSSYDFTTGVYIWNA